MPAPTRRSAANSLAAYSECTGELHSASCEPANRLIPSPSGWPLGITREPYSAYVAHHIAAGWCREPTPLSNALTNGQTVGVEISPSASACASSPRPSWRQKRPGLREQSGGDSFFGTMGQWCSSMSRGNTGPQCGFLRGSVFLAHRISWW
jgi:hypothetical protein